MKQLKNLLHFLYITSGFLAFVALQVLIFYMILKVAGVL